MASFLVAFHTPSTGMNSDEYGGNRRSSSLSGENLLFFKACLERTVEVAMERGLVDLDETALDSVRLEADAAGSSIRVAKRSAKVANALEGKDVSSMTLEQAERHDKRLRGHREAVEHCKHMNVTNYSRTDPLAALKKFPGGGAKPAHRLTTVVAGAAVRMCLCFVLSSNPTDHGLLRPTLEALRAALRRVGVADQVIVKAAVDAGFCAEDDLMAALDNAENVDVALAQQSFAGTGRTSAKGLFGAERFVINGDKATRPAGRAMKGPYEDQGAAIKWYGVDCEQCPLRVSSRNPATVQAEIVLKLVAYNLTRLCAAEARRARFFRLVDVSDWPDALAAAAFGFMLALQSPNWPKGASGENGAARAAQPIL